MNNQKDRLSSLPAELLNEIFERVHDPTKRLTTPLSKSLLPFQERPLFNSLWVCSYKSLETLCTIARDRPVALSRTRSVNISIPCKSRGKGSVQESNDDKDPKNKVVRLFYRKLARVSSLTVMGSSRLVQLVLDPAVAASAFPALTDLSLASTFHSVRDPFQPAFYSTLQYYTELKTFGLCVWRKSRSIHPFEKPLAQIPPFPTKVNDFTLRGPLSASISTVKSLLHSFGSLLSVSLSDTSESPCVYPLVAALFKPEEVKNLWLDMENRSAARPNTNDLAHLVRMTSLESLIFEGHASPPIFSSLQRLPLVSLAFEFGTQVSLSELAKLITGPTKHQTLKKMLLDNIDGERGTTIEEVGEPYYDEETETMGVWPDWILPDWSDEFNEEGLVKFIKLAEKEGIDVEGTAIEAIGIDEEIEEEEAMLAEYEEGLEDFDGCG